MGHHDHAVVIGLYAVLAATSQGFVFDVGLMIGMYGYVASIVRGLPWGYLLQPDPTPGSTGSV